MNDLLSLMMKIPAKMFVGSLSQFVSLMRELEESWDQTADSMLQHSGRQTSLSNPAYESNPSQTISEQVQFAPQPAQPATVPNTFQSEINMSFYGDNVNVQNNRFGTRDLSGDDTIKLVDFTISFVKYDREIVLHHGRRIVEEDMQGSAFEREVLEQHNSAVMERLSNHLKERKEKHEKVQSRDIWVSWYVIDAQPRDDAEFERRKTGALEALEGRASRDIVDAINRLSERI